MRCLQAVVAQAVGVERGPVVDHLLAVIASPHHFAGKGFEDDSITAFVFEAEHQIDRAFEQSCQQPRALGECCRIAEETDLYMAPAIEWYAVTGDGQPFAVFQALVELQHHRRVEFTDLNQP